MKLATYRHNGDARIGKVVDDAVIDIHAAAKNLPRTMLELLQAGERALAIIDRLLPGAGPTLALKDVSLAAPVPNPSKYLAIGLNYRDHLEEHLRRGGKPPTTQIWFNKQVSCITGPFDPIEMPNVSTCLDYELELGVVIGRRCKHVRAENARAVIAGYVVVNDVSVRDWQLRSPTWTMGKSFDTHGPTGPWLLTDDDITDPHNLAMRLTVNGELRQSTSTSTMLANTYEQIEHLSTVMTLEPGDILATGTPAGVGIGFEPPLYLKVGDIVRAEIETIGHIENTVVACA